MKFVVLLYARERECLSKDVLERIILVMFLASWISLDFESLPAFSTISEMLKLISCIDIQIKRAQLEKVRSCVSKATRRISLNTFVQNISRISTRKAIKSTITGMCKAET